jgi:hypothetical protein
MVSVDQSMANTGRALTGLVGPGYGLGFGLPCGVRWCGHVVLLGHSWAMIHGRR